jgi:hypothetical protein
MRSGLHVGVDLLRNENENIQAFVGDIEISGVKVRRREKYGTKNRFHFALRLGDKNIEIVMPRLPLEQVRYLGSSHQHGWNFPRLYVNGHSWLWNSAINAVKRDFNAYIRRRGAVR